jgi:hypothetical protein
MNVKRFIFPVILVVCIAAIIFALVQIQLGPLAIDIIKRVTRLEITYNTIDGSILRGYMIEDYCIRISETDSICGKIADIHYRFVPSLLRLPSIFEITLIEPEVCITPKQTVLPKKTRPFSIPTLSTGIRLNIKNGRVDYYGDNPVHLENISGLVFIDLIGSIMYLNTRNLSINSTYLPVDITSINTEMRLSNEGAEILSLRAKGTGFTLTGRGSYHFAQKHGVLEIKNATLDLGAVNIHQGTLDFSGSVTVTDKMIYPQIKGSARGVTPVVQCYFETNTFGDTIFINIFDGLLYHGNVFAQAKVLGTELYEIEMNFKNLDLAELLETDYAIEMNGFMAYQRGTFQGLVSSPQDKGVGVDSLYLYGTIDNDSIYIDSLIVQDNERILYASGRLFPACDVQIELNDLAIDRFARFVPLPDTAFSGVLTGSCHLVCLSRLFSDLKITASLLGRDLRISDVMVEEAVIRCEDFNYQDRANLLECRLVNPSYKELKVDSLHFMSDSEQYRVKVRNHDNLITLRGDLRNDLTGTITTLSIVYHGIETHNNSPMTFDIPNQTISDFDLDFAGGTLRGSMVPLSLDLADADLGMISTILNLPDPIEGSLGCRIRRNRIFLIGEQVDFLGLQNGVVQIKGEVDEGTIQIEELTIDDSLQHLTGQASLSQDTFNINTSFTNVGLWVLPFLKEFMDAPDGRVSGSLGLAGTVDDYRFSGIVDLYQGSFIIEPLAARFDSVQGEVHFDGTRIVFKTGQGLVNRVGLHAVSGSRQGIAYAGGLITLGPRFKVRSVHYDFSFQDAPLQFMPFAYGIGSGNISLGVRNDTTYYNGAITIKQAIVPLEFGQQFEEDTAATNERWTMNIKIKGERNIWLRNRDADIEMGGELFLIKERGPLYLTGLLNTKRGNYYWLNHTLSITEGQLIFLPQDPVDAELDIWAEMDTRDRDPTTGTPITIRLHMFGTISEPIFEFFSEPPYYTEQDIVTYLNLNITWSDLESMKRGDFVRTVLPHSLLSWLESDVSRRIRQYTGLDYFRIETPFFEDETSARLTVGKYISRRLFISYTYDVTSFENAFNVEYFIDDKNEILIRRDEEGEYSVQYQHRIRF